MKDGESGCVPSTGVQGREKKAIHDLQRESDEPIEYLPLAQSHLAITDALVTEFCL